MATKKKSKTPAVRYLRYELTNGSPGVETSHYIDLAKDLSRLNRRLYRQGRDYHVKRITVISANTPNSAPGTENRVSFSTAGAGWVSQQAWTRGFKVWNASQQRASRALGNDISAKWRDFKVYLTDDMRTGTVLDPLDNGGNAANSGEWSYSQLVTPDGTTGADAFYLHLLGDHNGAAGSRVSVGLVKSYGESRTTVDTDQPNVNADIYDDPLVNVMDDGTVVDETLERMADDNDNAPYQTVNYPGDNGNLPKPQVVQDTTIVDGRAVVGGFTARCGLIEVEAKSSIDADVYSILVELAPGSYRGIAADVI